MDEFERATYQLFYHINLEHNRFCVSLMYLFFLGFHLYVLTVARMLRISSLMFNWLSWVHCFIFSICFCSLHATMPLNMLVCNFVAFLHENFTQYEQQLAVQVGFIQSFLGQIQSFLIDIMDFFHIYHHMVQDSYSSMAFPADHFGGPVIWPAEVYNLCLPLLECQLTLLYTCRC